MSKFNEEEFDYKVAQIISKIHKKNKPNKFNEWVNNNLSHLEYLYELADIDIDQQVFYSYVYDNSECKI